MPVAFSTGGGVAEIRIRALHFTMLGQGEGLLAERGQCQALRTCLRGLPQARAPRMRAGAAMQAAVRGTVVSAQRVRMCRIRATGRQEGTMLRLMAACLFRGMELG